MARRLISDFTVTAGDHVRFYSDSACTQRIDVFDAGTGGTDYQAWYTAPTGGVITGLWVQDGIPNAWARVENPTSSPGSAIPLTVAPSTNPSSSVAATDVSAWQGNTYYPVGRLVVNPSGDIVRCTTAHTATGSYDATKFTSGGSAAYGAGSTQWLQSLGGTFGFGFATITGTDTGTGLPTAGAVKWPDGTGGAFTGTIDGGGNGYSGWVVTWTGGTTKTVTVTGVTYDSNGNPLGPTSVAVS
jgi:hypothetical protein